ncbi:Cullin-1 [Apostasia shenzhenica]|uniref:Cullin-1 n=1 Tax=Apostasia shenzhenica TaxID=1088818 RepID=A0A2I0AFK6_9ASPA|nr:Cullin-1 [Apostasia shenzhenica]
MLRKLVKRRSKHNIIVRWLLHFFHFLHRYFTLVDQKCKREQTDIALLKNVLNIFVEIGLGSRDCYENDIKATFLEEVAVYYSHKASNWVLEDSCLDYMLKDRSTHISCTLIYFNNISLSTTYLSSYHPIEVFDC